MKMPFGKHEGVLIDDLDEGYVVWIQDQPWFKERWSRTKLGAALRDRTGGGSVVDDELNTVRLTVAESNWLYQQMITMDHSVARRIAHKLRRAE